MKSRFGPYTTVDVRDDGRARIRFEVPPARRPEGWPKTIPIFLPGMDGVDLNALTTAQEAELFRQAKGHYIDFCKAKASAEPAPAPAPQHKDMWAEVIAIRKDAEPWRRLAETSKATYLEIQRRLLNVCRDKGLSIESTRESEFERIFRDEFTSKVVRAGIYRELHTLVDYAIVEGLRPPHLLFRPSVALESAEIQLWEESDIHVLVTAALQADEPGLAKLILAQWEVGQRLTSARNFRYGHQYRDGMFVHRCRKTNREVRIPVLNVSARRILDRDYRYGEYMFPRAWDGRPFTEKQLSSRFHVIRTRTPGYQDSRLVMRCLRHTCVLQLARAGCTIPEIGSVTGHALISIYGILSHYLSRDDRLAYVAMSKREKLRLDGIEGEVILEPERRVFLGPVDPAAKPLTPQELVLYGL